MLIPYGMTGGVNGYLSYPWDTSIDNLILVIFYVAMPRPPHRVLVISSLLRQAMGNLFSSSPDSIKGLRALFLKHLGVFLMPSVRRGGETPGSKGVLRRSGSMPKRLRFKEASKRPLPQTPTAVAFSFPSWRHRSQARVHPGGAAAADQARQTGGDRRSGVSVEVAERQWSAPEIGERMNKTPWKVISTRHILGALAEDQS